MNPRSCFPTQEEQDEHDSHSLHCLITHNSSNRPAGCVRLVPAEGDVESAPLPLEKHCGDSLDTAFIQSLNLPRESVCEISRLAVDGAFRRRSGESASRYGGEDALDCTGQERRTFSLIAISGFLAATALTEVTGRTNVFAMMEPFLPRMLKRSGIHFQEAGEEVDYHGKRAPYFITTQSALKNMQPDLKSLYNSILQQTRKDYTGAA